MMKMLGYLFQTQKKYYLDKILLFRVNTITITGRVKKGNSAEIEQVLVIIWWALNQAVVVEVKSICLHRSCSQTSPPEIFCSAYGTKSISAVKRIKTVYVLPKQLLPEEEASLQVSALEFIIARSKITAQRRLWVEKSLHLQGMLLCGKEIALVPSTLLRGSRGESQLSPRDSFQFRLNI